MSGSGLISIPGVGGLFIDRRVQNLAQTFVAEVTCQSNKQFAPGAPRETYFRELADISSSGRVLSDEEWTDLFARHDQYRAT